MSKVSLELRVKGDKEINLSVSGEQEKSGLRENACWNSRTGDLKTMREFREKIPFPANLSPNRILYLIDSVARKRGATDYEIVVRYKNE